MADRSYIRTIGLSDHQREELLNRLDRRAQDEGKTAAARNRRLHQRWVFRQADIPMIVAHPGGGVSRLLVCGRNISTGGLAFMHGGYLHKGSRCRLALRQTDGDLRPMSAHVANCRLIEGALHEIGIAFDERIDPNEFIQNHSSMGDDESANVVPLAGHVLCVDSSVADLHLIQFLLSTCGLEVTTATNGVEGLEMADPNRFQVLLTELVLPAFSGLDLIKGVRETCQALPIIAMTADERVSIRDEALAGGANDVLIKPLDFKSLSKVLRKHLHAKVGSASGMPGGPLLSEKWSDARMQPLILEYLDLLQHHVEQLKNHVQSNSVQDVEQLCLAIKGSAGGYGYPSISLQAEALRKAVGSAAELTGLNQQFQQLFALCQSACSIRPGTGPQT